MGVSFVTWDGMIEVCGFVEGDGAVVQKILELKALQMIMSLYSHDF
jgi:hypothetical protein